MATSKRPIFIPIEEEYQGLFIEKNIMFEWHMGMSIQQRRKSITSLHEQAKKELWLHNILEISSKSENELWIKLSAFNLELEYNWIKWSVESFFQWSKKFTHWGPFRELYNMRWREAKINKEKLTENKWILEYFDFFGEIWSLKLPETIFYDRLYINALIQNEELTGSLEQYNGFSDIAFNPNKSINCQARSVAIFLSLKKLWYPLNKPLSKEEIIKIYENHKYKHIQENINGQQKSLF